MSDTYRSGGKLHTMRNAQNAKRGKKSPKGKGKKRSLSTKIGDAVDATKYVAEDVKRKVKGEPSQRQERDKSDAKVKKMNETKDATELKTMKKFKSKLKKRKD